MRSFKSFITESHSIPPGAYWMTEEESSVLHDLQDEISGLKILCLLERKINSRMMEHLVQFFYKGEMIGGGFYEVDLKEGTADTYKFAASKYMTPQGKSIWNSVKKMFSTKYREIWGKFED